MPDVMGDNAGTDLFFLPSNVKKDAYHAYNTGHSRSQYTQPP